MPSTPITSSNDDRQEKKLDEALANVKVQSFQMKVCLDKNKPMEALKHASNMLSELRTNLLSPKAYYELYIAACDQLRHLEMYLLDEFHRGRKMADLYELVQCAGNIIPRLYLLITVGLVYMKTTPGSRRDILKDLVEMCRGVQHPLRGLFLRNYLLTTTRTILPDVTVEDYTGDEGGKEDHSGTIEDTIEFILLNFAEMNKLWVRMQHQGHTRDKDRREKERLELRLLVGTNLVRLSQQESIDVERYKNVVLPGILEQVVSCRDGIAQEYLMECLIQVFPDEFHLATLQPFLNSCAQLVSTVNVKNIIIALIDRLAASKDIDLPDELFEIFSKQISNIIRSRSEMPLEDIILMEGSLINFSIKKISQEAERDKSIDSVLENLHSVLKEKCTSRIQYRTSIGKELLKFLKLPITQIDSQTSSSITLIKTPLKLANFRKLLRESSDLELQKQIVLFLLTSVLDFNGDDKIVEEHRLSLEEIEDFLTELCEPLWKPLQNEEKDSMDEDFIDEQTILARFIHYLLSPFSVPPEELDLHFLILQSCKRILGNGGAKRIHYTFPSILFQFLNLALKYSKVDRALDPKWDRKCYKIFQLVDQAITGLNESNCPGLCLRLCLQAALNASKTDIETSETVAYEFSSKAFLLYGEEISDLKEKAAALLLIIGTVKAINFKSQENFQPLRSQCALFASHTLAPSPDKVRGLLWASLLFSDDSIKDMVKCVKKSVKIASSSINEELRLQLYVEIFCHLTLVASSNDPDMAKLIIDMNDNIKELKKDTKISNIIETQYTNAFNYLKIKKFFADETALNSEKQQAELDCGTLNNI